MSVDPLTRSYPWYTPYQFAGNKPIAFIDLDGLEEAPYQWGENEGDTELESGNYSTTSLPSIIVPHPIYRKNNDGPYTYEAHWKGVPNSKFELDINNFYREFAGNRANHRNKSEIARRLLKHYEVGLNEPYELTEWEMGAVKSLGFDLSRGYKSNDKELSKAYSKKFAKKIAEDRERFLSKFKDLEIGKSTPYNGYVSTGAEAPGTLGNFQVIFDGQITRTSYSTYSFSGTYQFSDTYDFNIGTEGRSLSGIIAVLGMRSAYPTDGGEFSVTSIKRPIELLNRPVNMKEPSP